MASAGDVGFLPEDGMWCPPGGVASLVGMSSGEAGPSVLRSGGLKVRLAQVDCVGEFRGKGSGRVFGNNQR